MSETKDISKKRLADFLAARLRAKRTDQRQVQQATTDSRPVARPRSEETSSPVVDS